MTSNHWRLYPDHIALWKATFPVPSDPRGLLAIVAEIIEAASSSEVALFAKADGTLWTRSELLHEIERTFEEHQALDFFAFSKGHMKVRSKVSYWDGNQLIDSVVADLKELLCTVRPDATEHWLPHHGREPLKVYGNLLDVRSAPIVPSVMLKIDTTSDLWLPWVPWFSSDHFFDNRELAIRNAARLNSFLGAISELATASGGSFEFANTYGEDWVDAMVGREGIKLIDAPPAR